MIFKPFVKWLETRLSRPSAIAEVEEVHIPVGVRVRPKENIEEDYAVEVGFDAEVPGRIENRGPGKNVFVPHKNANQDMTDPELSILSDSSLDANKNTGFDPYDTGCFDTSKTWKSPKSN